MVVVKGQCTNFTVVWVGVLLWDILKCTVRNVGIGGHGFLALSTRCLVQNLLRHLPQAHGTISGPCERQQKIAGVRLFYLPLKATPKSCRGHRFKTRQVQSHWSALPACTTLTQQFSFRTLHRPSLIYLKLPCCRWSTLWRRSSHCVHPGKQRRLKCGDCVHRQKHQVFLLAVQQRSRPEELLGSTPYWSSLTSPTHTGSRVGSW